MIKENCFGPHVMRQMQRALARWKKLWDAQLPNRDTWGSFMKNAPEFWQLANILVEVELKGKVKEEPSTECDLDSMSELNTLLQQFSL